MTSSAPYSLTAEEHARIDQIDRWAALGAAGIDELVAALSDRSWTVRRAVVAALAASGDDAVAALARWLRERRTSEHAIAAAVDALADSRGGAAVAAMIALLDERNPAVVVDAAQVLRRKRAVEAVAALARLLDHDDDNVAVAAIDALGAIGGATAVEPLIAVFRRRNYFRTFAALQVLPRTADPRVVAPIAALLDDDTYRIEALQALGSTGSARAIAPIAGLLAPSTDALVPMIAHALAELIARAAWIGADEPVVAEMRARLRPSLDRFVAALRSASPTERAAIATVLGRIGDSTSLPALAPLLDDPALVDVATDAIQRIGRDARGALLDALAAGDPATRVAVLPIVATTIGTAAVSTADVVRLLADDSPEVRARACDALARIGDTSVVAAVFGLLGDPNARVAHAAAAAIQSLNSVETTARAIAAIASESAAIRRQALRIVGYLGCRGAFEAVHRAVDDSDRRVAELAIIALGALDDERVPAALAELAAGRAAEVRAAVMRALPQRKEAAAIALLERGLADPAPWVRYYACKGLGQLARVAAAPLLVARLGDDVPHVRIAAIEALAHLDTPIAWQAMCAAARSRELDEQRVALAGLALYPTAPALPYLLDASDSTDVAIQLIALSGLARRPEPAAVARLAAVAARDGAIDVVRAALSLLAQRPDRAAADAIVDIALASDPDHPAHGALSSPSPTHVAAIAARLAVSDEREAPMLVAALARMRSDEATGALVDALDLASPFVRRTAATTLVAIGARTAHARIAALAASDPDVDVRRVCAAALSIGATG